MQIIDPHAETGWVTAIIAGRWCQAKVYDEPSDYGINEGRVSKLAISKTAGRDPCKPFFPQMAYSYDRGLNFDNLPKGLLDKIVAELEALPRMLEESS